MRILYYNIDIKSKGHTFNNIQDPNKFNLLDVSRYSFFLLFLTVITVFISSVRKEHVMAIFWAIVLV